MNFVKVAYPPNTSPSIFRSAAIYCVSTNTAAGEQEFVQKLAEKMQQLASVNVLVLAKTGKLAQELMDRVALQLPFGETIRYAGQTITLTVEQDGPLPEAFDQRTLRAASVRSDFTRGVKPHVVIFWQ